MNRSRFSTSPLPSTVTATEPQSGPDVGMLDEAYEPFIPVGYEPNYPYPLLIMLQDAEQSAAENLERLHAISDRNFIGISLPVTTSGDSLGVCRKQCLAAIQDIGWQHAIHDQRIFIHGAGHLATRAVELALVCQPVVSGFIAVDAEEMTLPVPAFGGTDPRTPQPLRGLFTTSAADLPVAVREQLWLLHAAGIDVRTHRAGQDGISAPSAINRFVMQLILREQHAANR